ncbi:MAG: 4Fe-4S dicluster domain-containing protein [Oligoflexia bacterium]|nr:4Fe-4S dicluster domain-containing protein [Oligoflexia bacterium]
MIWDRLKDLWLLFGRMFPLPTAPGLREVGRPDRTSPVLVTCNFDLTVRKVIRALSRDGIDAWLLVAPTRGINVWCAAGGGHFTADTVVSILKTSGIADRVDHRRLILPQLSGAGVNIWSIKERTEWKPRFGPLRIEDLAAWLRRGARMTEPSERRVEFGLKDRFVMGTNLAFASLVFFILPISLASIWIPGLWWRSILLVFLLAVLNSVLVFLLPGKPGVQRGLALGILVAAVFAILSQTWLAMPALSTVAWAAWIVFLATYLGYDLPSWSPLWRADVKELVLGKRHTEIAVDEDKCIGCHLCDLVCPVDVFERRPQTRKYVVARMDACQACGACVENCPADAIITNFRAGLCSCPTCTVIQGYGALKARPADGDDPARACGQPEADGCCSPDAGQSEALSNSDTSPPACGCKSCSGDPP